MEPVVEAGISLVVDTVGKDFPRVVAFRASFPLLRRRDALPWSCAARLADWPSVTESDCPWPGRGCVTLTFPSTFGRATPNGLGATPTLLHLEGRALAIVAWRMRDGLERLMPSDGSA